MKPTSYSSADVCRLTGVSYRQLNYWTMSGYCSPSVRESDGSGDYRRWSETDVEKIRATKRLLDAGVSLQHIRKDGDPNVTLLNLLRDLAGLDRTEEAS